ncbi:MAG: tRNA-dihydrouridine synthase [bacterium]|nr:tRNA-dihydrouridine synthase [bacterium]
MSVYQQKKLILALSPMDGVTDLPMRQITKKYGQPDFLFTEFLNVEGWHHAPDHLKNILACDQKKEAPVIAQIYGLTPQFFYDAATEICARGFFGIDLNFGCPARTVVHNGAGGGLIKNPTLAKEIYFAARQATLDFAHAQQTPPLPVSIKTRIGFAANEINTWLPFLLELKPDLISLHGRTLKQGYSGSADWQAIAKAVAWRDQISPTTAIFGNGDVHSRAQAQTLATQSGVDGVLIGRAALGNPWVFNDKIANLEEKIQVALEHSQLFEKTYQKQKNYRFVPMRKYLAAYISSFPHAKLIRQQLMQAESSTDVAAILAKVH